VQLPERMPKCGYHGKLTAYERIGQILDVDTFKEMFPKISPSDPLEFVYSKGSYKDKIKETREKTGLNESVVCGLGKIHDIPGFDRCHGFPFFRRKPWERYGRKDPSGGQLLLRTESPISFFRLGRCAHA